MPLNYLRFHQLFLITLFISFQSTAQWIPVESGTTNQLWDVHFVNDTLGRAVGDDMILKTINGGLSWEQEVQAVSDTRFFGVHVKNELEAWAVGKKRTSSTAGRVHYTNDGGATWNVYFTSGSLPWWSVDFAEDGLHGAIVGQEGQILYTPDGGTNWFNRTSPAGDAGIIRDFEFYDGLNGIAVGYSSPSVGFIIKTSDGGSTWENIETNIEGGLYSVSFSDTDNGLAVGSGGRIYKTSDGGNSWVIKYTGANTLNSVHFYDNNTAFAVGNGGEILISNDSGENWTLQDSGTTYTLRGVYKNNSATSFAVGVLGTLIKDNCAQSGTLSFIDNTAAPFISTNLTNRSKIYFYYLVEDNLDTPPLCTSVEQFKFLGDEFVSIGAKYLGNGLAQFWLDFQTESQEKNITISLPDEISQDGITISLINLPPNFNISLKARDDWKQSIDLFAGGSVGLSLITGGIGAGASVAAAKQTITGTAGMGLNFERDILGNQDITRRLEVSAGLSVELPSINTVVPNIVETPKAGIAIGGLFNQTMRFPGIKSDTDKKAKAAFLLETISIGGLPVSPFAGVYLKALKNSLVELNPDVSNLYLTYKESQSYGLSAEGNISSDFGFKLGKIEFDILEASAGLTLSSKITNQIKTNKRAVDISLAGAFDVSSLNFKVLNNTVDLSKAISYKIGGEASISGLYNLNNSNVEEIKLSYENTELSQLSLLNISKKKKYEFLVPKEVIQNNINSDNLIGTAVAILMNGQSNYSLPYPVKLGVNYFTENLDNIYSQNPSSLGEFNDYNILNIRESSIIGFKQKLGVGLDVALGVGFGLELGMEISYINEEQYLESQRVVVNDTILPVVENTKFYTTSYSLKDDIIDLLDGTTLLLQGAFDELILVKEQAIEDGIEFIVEIGDSANTIAGNLVSDGEKWIVRKLNPNFTTIFDKPSSFKTSIKQAYVSRIKTEPTGPVNKINANNSGEPTLYIVSDNVNVNLIDVNNQPIKTFEPVTISLSIDQEKIDELEFTDIEKALARIYRYDDLNLSWVEVVGDENVDLNIVSTDITESSNYAIGISYDTANDVKAPDILDYYPQEGNILPSTTEYWANIYEPIIGVGLDLSQTIIKIDGVGVEALWDPVNNKILYTPEIPLIEGTHTFEVIVKDLNGNTNSIFSNFTVDSTLGTNYIDDLDLFKLYPNPTNGVICLKGKTALLNSISIYNTLGQHINTKQNNLQMIDITHLKTGLYYVKLNSDKGTRIIKVIKK